MDPLLSLFYPQSVAIVGISRKSPSLGRMILDNLVSSHYDGNIYLVNPKADRIGKHKVYNKIDAIPNRTIEVAVILTPPKYVPSIIEELGDHTDCKFAIIITAGFDTTLRKKIVAVSSAHSIRLVGPNSMGVFGINHHLSFSPIPIESGSFGFISQSGSIIAVAQESIVGSFGFSSFISLGNKIDINELSSLEFMIEDNRTKVIGIYLESFSASRKFAQTIKQSDKPILVVKGGRTEKGSQAVSSHTGALAGNYRLTHSLLHYNGAIMVNTIEHMIGLARYIAKFGINPHSGIVTISSAGGPGVLAVDEIIEKGLDLARLNETTVEKLQEVIPPFGNASNPLDLVADAGINRYIDTVNIVKDDPAVTTIIVIIVHPVLIETEPLLEALNKIGIPIICAYLGPEFDQYDHYENLIVFKTTKEIIDILSNVHQHYFWKEKHRLLEHVPRESPDQLTGSISSVTKLLKKYKFTFPVSISTSDYEVAHDWFTQQNLAIVMKLDHVKFSHKTDTGGVILNISTSDEFEKAWQQLQTIYDNHNITESQKVELQPFYSEGIELVIGIIKDQQMGHFLLLGAGGTMVEIIDDTVFLPLPVAKSTIKDGLQNLTIYPLLQGYRGSHPVDIDLLVDQIFQINYLVGHYPEIAELDINPLFVVPETNEFIVLDARMELEK